MPIAVSCACGESYNFKDEMAGQRVSCRACGQAMTVGRTAVALAPPPFCPIPSGPFDRDKFLLRQKHLAISEKYYVWDEAGQTILFVQRPAHLLNRILCAFALILVLIPGFIASAVAGVGTGKALESDPAGAVVGIICGVVTVALAIFIAIALAKKRHVNFYRDDTKTERLLQVFQDKKFQPIVATYTVADAEGNTLAYLKKNYLFNLVRKRWYCHKPSGDLVCTAKEDSIILSLLRRFLGTFFGLLRANYLIFAGDGSDHKVIGEFNRKFTLLDRYVLDLSADRGGQMDRRVALALGVMLDTGEKR